MTTSWLSRSLPCPTPSSAPMPSFFISASPSTSTFTPSLGERLRTPGEFFRRKNVRRLVDEIAREKHAIRDRCIHRRKGALRARASAVPTVMLFQRRFVFVAILSCDNVLNV